jgi:spermidine synthase
VPVPERLRLPILSGAVLLSGASALVFETLWFRQAGLLLGNAVWSSSLVLASFMGGLAIGNGLGSRYGARFARPLRVYAGLELVVGVTGSALVVGLPSLTPLLLPVLRMALPSPGLLGLVRAGTAFALLIVPASAMGLTLPVLVEALRRDDRRFAWTLGQLYGWNTAGAVAGALAGEMFLVTWVGVRGTALVATTLNLSAAAVAVALDRRGRPADRPKGSGMAGGTLPPIGPLVAAFGAGGLLLALEVVWFRLLLLNVLGTSLTFSVMLAVVLAGIASGGLLASALARAGLDGRVAAPIVALLGGVTTVLAYRFLPVALERHDLTLVHSVLGVLSLAVPLMLPTSILSGLLFPILGEGVRHGQTSDARAAGFLTLANTLGAMLGALVGGFVLLPRLGIETSLLILSTGYGLVAVAALPAARRALPGPRALVPTVAAAVLLAGTLATFPFGAMSQTFLPGVLARWVDAGDAGVEVLAVREGLMETALLYRQTRWGTTVGYRLLTNAISMAGLDSFTSRYTKTFVYLPIALHPDAKTALLISYGVGSTAKALTDTSTLESIDVVDISRDVIEVTRAVYPEAGTHPLDDPRVRLHVEDGRFFLLTSERRFDVITGEPPPPNNAGVTSLYSREYFALMKERLAEGGIVSYWLPAYQLRLRDSQSIAAAFCSVFSDCTLWSGIGAEWVLLGTRGARPVSEEAFARQWRSPVVAPMLSALGFERPEDLGVTFLGGADVIAEWTRGVPPLDDDHPHRVSPRYVSPDPDPYLPLAAPTLARVRFEQSDFVRRMLPARLRDRIASSFLSRAPITWAGWVPFGVEPTGLRELHAVLVGTSARTGVLWLMGSNAAEERAAREARERGDQDPEIDEVLGVAAMADRDYRLADRLLATAQAHAASPGRLVIWRALARCLAGEASGADFAGGMEGGFSAGDDVNWEWLHEHCDVPE